MDWSFPDVLVLAIMVLVAGGAALVAWRRTGKYRVAALMAIALTFVWLWAELAVGVFTNWGS
jgi:hypothetical protein